ncbi:MAG: HYR domain-containing protein [Bacteroidota bacterium]
MQKILLTVFLSLAGLVAAMAQVTFTAVSPPVSCETNNFCVDIDVQNFNQITGLEFATLWDTSEFDYVSHTFNLPAIPTDIVDQNEGYMAFSWFGPFTGLTLPDDSTIIELCLTRKATAGTTATIDLGAQPGQGVSISDLNNGILVENVTFFFNDAQLTITDTQDPVITCPPDVTVFESMPGGLAPLTLSDNCDLRQVTYTLGGATNGAGFDDASPTTLVEGTTSISYLAEDFGGNTNGCMFNVTYNDTTPLDPNILYFDPLIKQDCATGKVTVDFRVINFDSLTSMQMGISWDTSILVYTNHTNVELNPGTDPFNTALTADGTLGLIWTLIPASADGLSLADSTVIFTIEFDLNGAIGLPLFTYGDFGPLLFEISRFDNSRLTMSEYEFLPGTIDASDSDPPVYTGCPMDITINANAAACGANFFWTEPTATDNCDNMLDETQSHTPGAFFPLGVDTIVYIATDDAGLSDTCLFTVTVEDNSDPILGCPLDQSVDVDPGNCSAVVMGIEPTVVSNCPADTTYTITGATNVPSGTGDASNTTFAVGVSTVTYTVTESSGRTATCSFTVTVSDNTIPTISCPSDQSVNVDPGTCTATLNGLAPTITNDCPITTTYSITGATIAAGGNDASGTAFRVGQSVVTYTTTESSGNSNTCSFTVTVADNENPSISCPADVVQDTDAGRCNAAVSIPVPTTSDNCGVASVINNFNNGTDASDTYPVGTTTVVWTVTDDNGNTATCSIDVTVNDNTLPSVSCPASLTIDITSGTSEVVNGIDPVVSDACGIATTTYRLSNGATGNNSASGLSFDLGTTTVTYIATDVNGNTDSCQFDVTIRFVSSDILDCPADVNTTTDAGVCSAVVNNIGPIININMADLSSVTYTLEQSGSNIGSGNDDASGTAFPTGLTTVEYIANDRFGNADTCSFTVTVADDELPTWSNCPADITVFADASCMGNPTWSAPIAADNCAVIRIDSSQASGSAFGLGTTLVTYTAFDAANNSASCTFNVTVQDNTPPTFDNCGANNLVLTYLPDCRAIGFWDAITATDNCGTAMITCTHNPGDTLNEGTTRVVCLVVDMAGNTNRCEFDLEVRDTTPPVANSCPPNVVVSVDEGRCTANVTWDQPIFSDNCTSPTLSSTHPSGFDFPLGSTTVTYTATDASGNTATCSFDVTVSDDERPVVLCDSIRVRIDGTVISDPGGIVLTATPDNNCQGIKISFTEPTATDNCDTNVIPVQTSSGPGNGDTFPEGETLITYTATDASGNEDSCVIQVIVEPLSMIQVLFQPGNDLCEGESVTLSINNTNTNLSYSWSGPNGFSSTEAEPIIDPLEASNAGQYCVTVTTPEQCSTTSCGDLTVRSAPAFTLGSNGPVCNTDLSLTATLADTSIPVDTWTWTFPDGQIDNSQNPVVPNPDLTLSGDFIVVANGNNGCSSTDTISVEVNNIPPPELTTDCDPVICLGTSCRLIGTEYLIVPDQYNWVANPASNAGLPADTDNNELSIIPTEPGIYLYDYWVSRGNCESDTASLTLQVVETPIAEDDLFTVSYETTLNGFNILLNDTFETAANLDFSIQLFSDSIANGTLENLGGGVFNYTPDDGYIGIDQFAYEICYNCDGDLICEFAVVTLNVVFDGPCQVPNVISPNGDEFNDVLQINCLDNGEFNENEIIIFNQWGDEVFRQKPYTNDWGGTYQGNDLPDGTYYYIFKVDPNADPDKGFIQILR